MSETQIEELIARSNRLGADPRNTNFAGGNTSAKGTATDPVTGKDVEVDQQGLRRRLLHVHH
jgi:rhamnose utilization protein RhaD (predicted bifunctional aldolase and dehydrogenase)